MLFDSFFTSIRRKLGVALMLVALSCSAATCAGMYWLMRTEAVEIMQGQLRDSAALMASEIDAEKLSKIQTPASAALPEYTEIQLLLQAMRKRTEDIKNVYTLRLSPEGHPVFVVDEPPESGKESAAIGELLADEGGAWEARMKTPGLRELSFADDFISSDRFGRWLSGFAPVRDSKGDVVAFLGVDIDASHVGTVNLHLACMALAVFFGVAPLSLFLGWRIGCGMAEPLVRLKQGLDRARALDFDFVATPASTDEIGALTDAFNEMQSDLKDATRALEESEAKFKGIVEGSPNCILLFDMTYALCVGSNMASRRIFGGDENAQLSSRSFESFWTGASKPAVCEAWAKASSGKLYSFEADALVSGGSSVRVVVVVNPVVAPTGMRQAVCVMTDISAQAAAARALSEKNEFLNQLIESIPYPVFYKDERGRYLNCNRAFVAFCGLPKEKIIGNVSAMVLPNVKELDFHERMDAQALNGNEPVVSYEAHLAGADGQVKDFIVYKAAYKLASGRVGGVVGSLVDISERAQMERSVKRAKDKADAANYAKSRFLANVSHEIRTPLNCMIGILDMMRETKLSEDQRELVGTMDEAGRMLMSAIGDILDLAKIESGRMSLEERPCDLNEFLVSLHKLFGPLVERKGLEFRCPPVQGESSWVFCDSARLLQVLSNLVGNALKFTRTGFIEVRAECSPVLGSASKTKLCRFFVIDSGEGIAKDKLESVFDEFTQEDASVQARHGGSGLGLTICRHLVRLMGGEISVESEKGKGSCFVFEIPLKDAMDSTMLEPETASSEINLPADVKALVVEDHGPSSKLVKNMLGSFGCVCSEADCFADAFDLFSSIPFDFITVDLTLPDGKGDALIRQFRSIERAQGRKKSFIVAATACVLPEAKEQLFAAGADSYLVKPVSRAQLASALRAFCSASRKAG